MTSWNACAELVYGLRALKVDVPRRLVELLDLGNAIRTEVERDPLVGFRESLRSGSLALEDVPHVIREVAIRAAAATQPGSGSSPAHRIEEVATATLSGLFRDALDDADGVAVIESLRPGFDDAAASLRQCREVLGARPTAESVIEGGQVSIDAWQAAPKHAGAVDRIARLVTLLHTQFDLLRGHAEGVNGPPDLAFFVGSLTESGELVDLYRQTQGAKFGRWYSLAHRLRLNTPAEARLVLDGLLVAKSQELGNLPPRAVVA